MFFLVRKKTSFLPSLFLYASFLIVTNAFAINNSMPSTTNTNKNNGIPPTPPPSPDEKPLFTFGVIADIQYAPIPDGFSYGGVPRYYRHSIVAARHAAEHFQKEDVPLVVNLGDTIDGKCQEVEEHCKEELEAAGTHGNSETEEEQGSKPDPGHEAMGDVMEALSPYSGKIIHTYGNHELYNLSREDLRHKLNIPFVREPCGELVGYYAHTTPCKTVKFIVIDSYDVNLLGRNPDSSKHQRAVAIMEENNPNFPQQENSPQGLEGIQKRFVGFNGAVDRPQLEWLRGALEEAKMEGQKVIILSHQPIMPNSASEVTLIWNCHEVLDLLREYKCTVAAAFAGHAHRGGYQRDEESGIHFRIFEACLESPSPIKTYGFVDVHDDKLVVRGEGDCMSDTYILDHLAPYQSSQGEAEGCMA